MTNTFPQRALASILVAPFLALAIQSPGLAERLQCSGEALVSLLGVQPRPLMELR